MSTAKAVMLPYAIDKLLRWDLRVFQTGCFAAALLIYGAFGSPTPDRFGAVEACVLVLLILAVGGRGIYAGAFGATHTGWIYLARLFAVFTVPAALIMAAAHGHGLSVIARDAAAFVFLILPLCFLHFFRGNSRIVFYAALALGVLFSVRCLWTMPFLGRGEALFYLANMPTVLMAAIYFICLPVQEFTARFSFRSLPVCCVLLGLGVVCALPMIESQQRASLGVISLSVLFMMGWAVYKYPRRGALLLAGLSVALIFVWPHLSDLYAPLAKKTDLVGANMRAEEWRAVWGAVAQNPLTMMFGLGWGASFSSPAVADIAVNYTHGLFSSLLLKSGIIGMVLGAGYIGTIVWNVLRGVFVRPALMLAILFPILIDAFLYASFKSLDFGVVLLCAALFCVKKEHQDADTGVALGRESK